MTAEVLRLNEYRPHCDRRQAAIQVNALALARQQDEAMPQNTAYRELMVVLLAIRPEWDPATLQGELLDCHNVGMSFLGVALAALKLAAVADSEPRDLAHDRDHHNRRRNP